MDKNSSQIVISKKTLTIALIILFLLIIGITIVAFNASKWFGDEALPEGSKGGNAVVDTQQNPDIDPNAGKWEGQKLPDKTENKPATGIKIPGYPSITLPKDQQTVAVALLNPEGNPCYFSFELVLKDTGESLYKSKLVPPGQAITEITMARALAAGEYNATIKISTTSLTDGSAMNGANVETLLIVK